MGVTFEIVEITLIRQRVRMRKPIDRAIAKAELERINGALKKPHLLIGGLAVQQYYPVRDSKDIDLVCDFSTAQEILKELYPTNDWNFEDKQNDEYRPSYRITHKVDDKGTIIFGPKISEREAYNYIDWDDLMKEAVPFKTSAGCLDNIRVPTCHALAYTKFISFLGRQSPEDKIRQDLQDFVDLTNHERFLVNAFYNLLRRAKTQDELVNGFKTKIESFPEIKRSCLHGVSKMFVVEQQISPPLFSTRTLPVVYIAAPHKNQLHNNKIKDALARTGFSVKLPFEEVTKRQLSEGVEPEKIRAVCIDAIKASQFVVVDLDTYGLDTAWEIGFAEGLGKKIIGFNNDPSLITDARLVNRRRYEENFMHGWKNQKIFKDILSAATACKNKVVYVCGSFRNLAIETLKKSPLSRSAKRVFFPKDHLNSRNHLPRDYPLAERGETNRLLEASETVVIILPRYGMDTSWQIGYATAKGKQIIGILLDEDKREIEKASFWDHWMHGWKSKLRVMSLNELCIMLSGFAAVTKNVASEEGAK